jgi:molybdenum cofactor cytidylyltransferase
MLASGLIDPSTYTTDATTGRCNLHASQLGLLEIERELIDAANRVSESITIATLPERSLVHPDTLVATVKVIPFAVPRSDVSRCLDILRGTRPLRVAPFHSFEAGLVLTELPGVSQALLERASRAQRARLRALGSRVRREIRCQHSGAAVARALKTLSDEGCDPILLLGASAIVDRGDVIPAGLREAGGEVAHLGMPVDPGNLLMVGSLGRTTIFGLPGCARSLNPSGFDQVLRRHFVGEPVDSSFISGLGVGGLLKEIPGRPMPRSVGSPSRSEKRIAAIVLAAGESQRMGDANKLILPVDGMPMVARVADALRKSRAAKVIVVTGHEPHQIEEALGGRDVELVHNAEYAEGIASSIRTGVGALGDDVDGALIALGDMPWVEPQVIDRLVDAFTSSGELSIFIPMFGRKRGNPVLWGSQHFPELLSLTGDVGGKAVFHQHAEAICYVDVESAGVNIDVDTPEALHELGIEGEHDSRFR